MKRTVILLFFMALIVPARAQWSSTDSARLERMENLLSTAELDLWDIYENTSDIEGALSTVNSRLYTAELLHGSEVQLLREVTNLLRRASGGDSALAANPWWYTNSGFSTDYHYMTQAYPDSGSSLTVDFPRFLSSWHSALVPDSPRAGNYVANNWATGWWGKDYYKTTYNGLSGSSRSNFSAWRNYTWFDWMTDAVRSNWVLSSTAYLASGTNDLARWDVETGASSVDDEEPTHGSLPSLTLTQSDVDMSGSVALVDVDASGWAPSLTGADPSFTIYPGATVGGVTVSPVVASIALPEWVTRVIHGVAVFVWGVMFVASLIALGRHEFDFWSTLGGSAS